MCAGNIICVSFQTNCQTLRFDKRKKEEEEEKETINLGPNDDGELMFNARARTHTQIYTLKTASFDSQTDWLRNQAYQMKTETEDNLKQKRKRWK